MGNSIPRFPLLWGETPLEPLPRLAARIGVKALWIKRDDLTGVALGGNKLRKLEYLLGEAKSGDCDLIITGGSPQSNHARLTAGAARKAGLETWLCFAGRHRGKEQGNLFLDRLFGATTFLTGVYGSRNLLVEMEKKAAIARDRGRKPYVIPVGGSTPTGDYGYVEAWREWRSQVSRRNLPSIDTVVLAAGSGGTLAGLLAGKTILPAPVHLIGVSVWQKEPVLREEVIGLANGVLKRMDRPERVNEGEVHVTDRYIGPKYGVPSEGGIRAIRLLAETEGLLADPVYTGKALHGLIDLARRENWTDKSVLFWHTGGSPALFTHASAFTQDGSQR
ncbi:D-cysteine desulfhydrase [Melghirimyces profundicolus]|uniref:D-cysteine desulfhydrase n=1 Tax=Melghirimyces profundicolus TaxID=1242148 RepID=A0A2T6BV29_9BACL|nr:D-cysteine desulfhydrase family protein [Melghirimyces profundicolus]PTX59930.1 D-cysteine desulfhydrase [Melghirimyces profundicolus]